MLRRPRPAILRVLMLPLLAAFVLTHMLHAGATGHVAGEHAAHAVALDRLAAERAQAPHSASCLAIRATAPVPALAEAERHPSRLPSSPDSAAARPSVLTAAAPVPLFLLYASLLI